MVSLVLVFPAMVSTPDNKSSRPVSAPIMSPVSPGEATPSPLLSTLHRSHHHDSCTPKIHRFAEKRPVVKTESQAAEQTKSYSPKLDSAPEIKVENQ